jgi:predicted transcriptional regulator
MPFTIPIDITPLEKILKHLGIASFDQILTQSENPFESITKLREFLNGKLFAISTFQTIFRTFRKSRKVMQLINIKRIRLAPNLWIIIGTDESLFTISNEKLGIYGYLVTVQTDSKTNRELHEDPFKEFPEITEIVY